MSWIQEFNGVFFLSLATILAGAVGLSFRYCFKSKCENFSICCGLLSVDRRVDLETSLDMKALEMGIREDDDTHTSAERRPSLTTH
jgi:hypothetical protein